MTMPIIRLEVDHMRHSMLVALSEYQVRLDSDLKAAVEAYCTPENLSRILDDAVKKTLDRVIKEQTEHYFLYGDGRKAINEVVEKKLSFGALTKTDTSKQYVEDLQKALLEACRELLQPRPTVGVSEVEVWVALAKGGRGTAMAGS